MATRQETGADGRDGETEEIVRLLFGVAERMRLNGELVAAEVGLTVPQVRALLRLGRAAPMRALAAGLGCDVLNITGLADRLQARGLVRRAVDDADRRVKLLVLTPEGERVRAHLEERLLATSPVLTGLSGSERSTLRSLLGKIADGTPDPASASASTSTGRV